ncbi:MAG: aquaporin Z [Actinobacteria bacterium ATB1]|nr:aquaporin Z [Actinobacteria bacterium ATB1]
MNERARIFVAEVFGTAVLVVGGVGSAVLAGSEIGFLGVAIAFGLSLLVMAYTIGSISGCHINPAVTVGLWVLGKTKGRDVPLYVVAQVVGGVLGGLVVFLVASGLEDFSVVDSGFASNGYGTHSPGGYPLWAVAIAETVVTLLFVIVVVSTSRKSMHASMTGVSVGWALALAHLILIPVSNASVNPARSIATAVFQHTWALEQLWAFIVFPLAGAFLAGLLWRVLVPADDA